MSLQAMEDEVSSLMKAHRRVAVDWQMKNELRANTEFAELVVIKLTGYCMTETVPMPMDERGPLAFAYSSDGRSAAVRRSGVRPCEDCGATLPGRPGLPTAKTLCSAERWDGCWPTRCITCWPTTANIRNPELTRESLTAEELTADRLDLAAKAAEEMRNKQHSD